MSGTEDLKQYRDELWQSYLGKRHELAGRMKRLAQELDQAAESIKSTPEHFCPPINSSGLIQERGARIDMDAAEMLTQFECWRNVSSLIKEMESDRDA